ncbi:hypothetical protein [Pseudomonas cavernae]|uniref:hypothetical protein n=1 Tax=Pseudomonas cavernae TaxID=2320867 RepID=UPI0013C414B1|nr:hypothetical protein [Pseudomonas cavernae]
MLKYGIVLGIFSAAASVLAFAILKKASISIPIGCGLVSGLIMTYWFPRKQKRVPTPREFKTVTGIYGIFMAIVTLLPLLSAAKYTLPGLLTLGMYVLAYPVFFTFMFNEKHVTAQLQKNA